MAPHTLTPFASRVPSRFNTLPPISSGILNGVPILWNLSLTGWRVSGNFPIAKLLETCIDSTPSKA